MVEWDGAKVWCLASQPVEPVSARKDVRRATVIARDLGCTGIAVDFKGHVYCSERSRLFRLVPDKVRPPGFDCVRLGICKGFAPTISDYGKHLLKLNDLQSSEFLRPISASLKINILPLLERFNGDPDMVEKFISHVRNHEREFSSSDMLAVLHDWIYADQLPYLWWSGNVNFERVRTCATVLGSLFSEVGLQEEARICGAIAGQVSSVDLYDEMSRERPSSVSKAMLALFKSPRDADFTIHSLADDGSGVAQSIQCHSDLLRVRWPFFKTLIDSGFSESNLSSWNIRAWGDPEGGLSPPSVEALIRYFYTNEVEFIESVQVAIEILAMREYYLLETTDDSSHYALLEHCQCVFRALQMQVISLVLRQRLSAGC
jgi:hypothetical protein